MSAIEAVDGVSRQESERLFAQGVQYTDEEVDRRHRAFEASLLRRRVHHSDDDERGVL